MKEIKTVFAIYGSCCKLVRRENKNKLNRAERAINRTTLNSALKTNRKTSKQTKFAI